MQLLVTLKRSDVALPSPPAIFIFFKIDERCILQFPRIFKCVEDVPELWGRGMTPPGGVISPQMAKIGGYFFIFLASMTPLRNFLAILSRNCCLTMHYKAKIRVNRVVKNFSVFFEKMFFKTAIKSEN